MIKTDITGETMIFKNDNGFYSTSISKKKQDGSYDNAYINVSFRNGVTLDNKTLINIKSGWLSFDKYEKEGKTNTYLKIFVNDFDIVSNSSPANSAEKDTSGFASTDDLPF